jgi:hypothetical protein
LFAFLVAGAIAPQALTGQALLDDLSKRAVRYFWEQSHPSTGLTRDRAPNNPSHKHNNADIASIATTGYSLAAYAIGVERGWLNRSDALSRARLTLRTVRDRVEGKNGWYYHFLNWETGKREWNSEVSSIDSGLLFAGAIMAERGLGDPEFTRLADGLMKRVDWKWMLTDDGAKPKELFLGHGWKPEGFLQWRWAGFCELMFLYVLAYGWYEKMPSASWVGWPRQEIEYEGLNLMAGGPLFMHQMTQGFYDFRDYRDRLGYDYFIEGQNATLANRLYCIQNPKRFKSYGPEIWGLSACDIPTGYAGQGAPGWISDDGTLAPAAAVASVIYTPQLSTRAAAAFVREYPESYGRYGFVTGINPTQNWQSPDVIGIDIGQLMLNIENARDGLPHRWMMSRPDTLRAYERIGMRKTIEGRRRSLRVP